MVFVYRLRLRSDLFDAFRQFQAFAENQTDKKIKSFRSDNALEYSSKQFADWFKKCGIDPNPTVSHTPKQNGVVERMNRTLNDCARCMLIHSGLPTSLWFDAIRHASYVRNRVPSNSLPNDGIPYELWSGKKVDYSNFHVFGANCIMKIRGKNLDKIDVRGKEMIFIGHTQHAANYFLCDPNKHYEKQKGRDDCLLEDAVPRICSNEILTFENELDQEEQSVIQTAVQISQPLKFLSPSDDNCDDSEDCISFNPPSLSSYSSSTPIQPGGVEEEGEKLMPDSASIKPIASKRRETDVAKSNSNQNTRQLRSKLRVEQSDRERLLSSDVSNSSSVNEPHCWKRLSNRLARIKAVTVCDESLDTGELKFETVMTRHDASSWYEAMQKEINTLTELESWTLVKDQLVEV